MVFCSDDDNNEDDNNDDDHGSELQSSSCVVSTVAVKGKRTNIDNTSKLNLFLRLLRNIHYIQLVCVFSSLTSCLKSLSSS